MLPPARGRSIEVRKLDKADPCLKALPVTPDLLESRRRNGNIVCFGAFKRGRLIGCHWLALESHDDEAMRVRFRGTGQGRARFVWDFDLYVVPEERIGFAFARIWDEVFEYLRQAGIDWSLSYVSPINQRSRKSHETLGSARIASLLILGVGKTEFVVSNIAPYVGIAVGPAMRVEIPLSVPDRLREAQGV